MSIEFEQKPVGMPWEVAAVFFDDPKQDGSQAQTLRLPFARRRGECRVPDEAQAVERDGGPPSIRALVAMRPLGGLLDANVALFRSL